MHPSDIKVALDGCARQKLPVMMWGSPGIGKSSLVKEIGRKQGRPVYDIRLALLDPTDLRGIPFYNPETNTAQWAQSCILPVAGGDDVLVETKANGEQVYGKPEEAILFLDEINAAPPVVQAAAYQLVLDRRIGEYILPDGVSIVAAGNREGDKAVTFKMPTPLMNRFVHLEFEVDFDDWHAWAIENYVEPDVVGFLNFKKNLLNQFDAASKSRGFPTPRSWEFASRAIGNGFPDRVLRDVISGCVGEGPSIEFMTYREVYLKLPNPSDILDGKIKKMPEDNLSANYAMITSLGYELRSRYEKNGKGDSWFKAADTYMEFIHKNFDPEFCVMGVRDCLKTLELPMAKTPGWKKFAQDYAKLVMAA